MADSESKGREWSCYLGITRVPRKTFSFFKQFAEEEFANDYGMALKFLVDVYLGIIPSGMDEVMARIDELEERLAQVEEKPVKEQKVEKRVIRSISGKIIGEKNE
jgi:hypothetical protein